MKNKLLKCVLLIISIVTVSAAVVGPRTADAAEEKVYLGGFAAGFEVSTVGATVIKLTDVVTESGVVSPSKAAGIKEGDVILSVNGVDICGADDVSRGLAKGGEVVVNIKRNGETYAKNVTPALDLGGKYKLGVILRDGTSGIGTMTYITKDGKFMALGHPISLEDGVPVKVGGGKIFRCSIFGVNKAEKGKAGELKGLFITDAPIGKVTGNYGQGIGGVVDGSFDLSVYPQIELGKAEIGKASIVTCVDGVLPKEYSAAIVKSDEGRSDKNIVIKITDKELIDIAGGIVQGMSGSPIVQDGKLVGAVTHVFVNDPTRGYGISISNMLNANNQ